MAAIAALAAIVVAGCADNALRLAPPSPSEPWRPADSAGPAVLPDGRAQRSSVSGGGAYTVPVTPEAAQLEPPPPRAIDPGRAYRLPELIDIAALNNPATTIAWQQARQAALAVGVMEPTFLPQISASVICGAQRTRTPLLEPIAGDDAFTTTEAGIVPLVALQWLVFDFGQRSANLDAAQQNAFAANVSFNGLHQQVICDVTIAYFRFGAAGANLLAARQTLQNSIAIGEAATARMARGLGTSVEVAQARQQTAQAKLRVVQSEGERDDSYQDLLAAMGVSPMTTLKVAGSAGRPLPRSLGEAANEMIASALAQRPEVLSAYARSQASEAGIRAAQAQFRPKVYLSAVAADATSSFSVGGSPGVEQSTTSASILVGVTIPIYSG
jgi:outer membrane protein TolC